MLHTDLKVKHQTYVTTRIPIKMRHGRPYETVTGRAHVSDYISFWHVYSLNRRIYSTSNAIYFVIDNIEIPIDVNKGIY